MLADNASVVSELRQRVLPRERLNAVPAVLAAVGGAALLGWILSLATTRVVNWFVMTDELLYERRSIGIAQTGSLVPRFRGEVVGDINQLYPTLISPFFGAADVPASLVDAHRLNAFLLASALVPVFLLARRIGLGPITSLWVGALAVATPWAVLSSFLLTESVAYPAFCWALLALVNATYRRSLWWDVLALAAIAVAILARTQFAVLLLTLPAAILVEALLRRLQARHAEAGEPDGTPALDLGGRAHAILGAVFAAIAALFAISLLTGHSGRLLGSYSVTARGIRLDPSLLVFAAEHAAVLAIATGVVPFVLGTAWLCGHLRPSATGPERALAAVGSITILLLLVQVASFNHRFGGGEVKDRYLFYVLPLVLVGVGAAVSRRVWPSWWAWLAPALIVLVGLAFVPLPVYTKLNVDSPVAIFNDEILSLATSLRWAHILLPLGLVIAIGLLYELAVLVSRRAAALAVATLVTVSLAGGAVYSFDRLFAVNGTNGLPVTLDQGVVFNWVDRALGADGRVTMVPYPVNSPDYWAGVAYWWDVEFWNETVVRTAPFIRPLPNDEAWAPAFDSTTGAMREPGTTRYLLMYGADVRFRLAGRQAAFDRGAYVFEPERPWRADWVTDRIYGDGWTRPHVNARIRVFSKPGQRTPLTRYLTVSIKSPDESRPRPLTIRSNTSIWNGFIVPPEDTIDRSVTVCVPPRGFADVEIGTPFVSDVYRDPTLAPLTGEIDRPAGVLLRSINLADETTETGRCS